MPQIDLGQVVGAQGPQGIQGPQGAQGIQGPAGPAATINGVNALTIEAGENISLDQEGGTATLSVPTDAVPTADSTKPVQSGGVLAALNNKANRNLLDNWYFVGGGTNGKFPVNQRGQTSYAGVGFTIDRWYMGYVGGSMDHKTELLPDGLQISASMCLDNDVIDLHQNLVNGAALEGKTVTGSVLMVDGQLYQATFPFLQQATSIPLKQGLSLLSTSAQNLIIRSTPIGGSISNSIAAVKLELGSQQTLAHQDEDGNWVLNEIPDYGEELAKCQRYFQLYSAAGTRPAKAVDCRPVMRTDPVQSTTVIGETTYYCNNAEL